MIKKKKYAVAAFDPKNKAFVVYIISIGQTSNVYSSCKTQIALLKVDEAATSILSKYINFPNLFFENLVAKVLEDTKINDYAINLIEASSHSTGLFIL